MTSFEVIIDDTLYNLTQQGSDKNKILSPINAFEDGHWQYGYFNDYIFNNIGLTALSANEREKIPRYSQTQLRKACKNLRLTDSQADTGLGSEIAEILLYSIMSEHFNALPAVPKIYYKQNPNMYAYGADGVHIVLEKDTFSIWYGEAKFYKEINREKLKVIANSVHNSLQTAKIRKENSIITDLRELDKELGNDSRKGIIFSLLDSKTSVDKLKPHLHIPIMLLYECSLTASQTELTDEYKDKLKNLQLENAKAYFSIQDEICNDIFKYTDITFHLIYFPVPDKSKVVDLFTKNAKFYRENIQ